YEFTIVLVAISPVFFQFFFANQVSYDDLASKTGIGGTLRAGILAIVGVTGLIKYLSYMILDRGKINANILLLFLFLALAFGSVIYSIDKSNTLMRASFLTTVFFALLGVSGLLDTEYNFYKTLNLLSKTMVVLVIMHLLSLGIPGRSISWKQPRFPGFSNHAHQLGAFFRVA